MYYIWRFNKIRRGKAKLKPVIYVKKTTYYPCFVKRGNFGWEGNNGESMKVQ